MNEVTATISTLVVHGAGLAARPYETTGVEGRWVYSTVNDESSVTGV